MEETQSRTFTVQLEQFSGPMEALLSLIEKEKLQITDVSLARVTNDFVAYVDRLQRHSTPDFISDFLLVASKLLLIKSKVLLPDLSLTPEEEESVFDLELRLKLYQEFKRVSSFVADAWETTDRSYARRFLHASHTEDVDTFYPSDDVKIATLFETAEKLAGTIASLLPKERTVSQTMVTLQERIEELSEWLHQRGSLRTRSFLSGKDREETIVSFLAILHMLARQIVEVTQDEQFGDMIVSTKD